MTRLRNKTAMKGKLDERDQEPEGSECGCWCAGVRRMEAVEAAK